jgi:hypothetical protein
MPTLALPETVSRWSLTSLREKLVKIGARIVTHEHKPITSESEQ